MISFVSASAKNFGSFQDLSFNYQTGKTVILGSNLVDPSMDHNACGKTWLFELIYWVLYKQCRDKNPSFDSRGNCMGEVVFNSDNNHYVVTRYWDDEKLGNNVKITCNGEDISAKNKNETDDIIQKTIGMSYELFILTVVVCQGLPLNFSTLQPTLRKTLLEESLGFLIWQDMRSLLLKEQKAQESIKIILDTEYETKNQEYINSKNKIETLNVVLSESKEELKKELDKNMDLLTENQGKLLELETLMGSEDPNSRIMLLDTEIQNCIKSIEFSNNRTTDLAMVLNTSICPTCGQDFPKEKIQTAQEEYEHFKHKLENVNNIKETKIKELNMLREQLREKQTLITQDKFYRDNIKSISDKANTDKISKDIEQLEKDIIKHKKDVDELIVKRNENTTELDHIQYLDSLLLPSSPFRSFVLEQYLNHINIILSYISPMVFDGVHASLAIDSKKAGIDIVLKKGEKPYSYKALSGGEKRRLDVIIILALQKFILEHSGVSSNLIVFDEIFDGLDTKGIELVIGCLDSLFGEDVCTYIITHRDDFKSMFDQIITVIKDKGGISGTSRIQYGK